MTKFGFLLILLFISTLTFSQTTKIQDFEKLDVEKVKKDLKIIKAEVDSTFFYIGATFDIIREEIKLFGWRKTVQINWRIFKPYIIFLIMYIIWLIKRKR